MNAHVKYNNGDSETFTCVRSFSFENGILVIETRFDEIFNQKDVRTVSFTQVGK